jgi:hypothetical protein
MAHKNAGARLRVGWRVTRCAHRARKDPRESFEAEAAAVSALEGDCE